MYEGQTLDHPRVNPNFYSQPTRYVYFIAAKPMEQPGDSGPPQVIIKWRLYLRLQSAAM